MPEDRETASAFLRSLVSETDWIAALDDAIDPEMRERGTRLIRRLAAGDIDGLLAETSPDLLVRQPPEVPDGRTYTGHQGFVEAILDWPSQWDSISIEPIRTWQAAPDVLISQTRQRVRGIETGIELEGDFWFVYSWRDDRFARWTMHTSQREAESQASAPSSSAS